MAFATVQDVSETLGRPITAPEEVTQVGVWLRRAESIIRNRIPSLDVLAEDANYLQALVDVEADVVARKVKNPDGKVSGGVDDYNFRYNENTRKGEIFLTDDEWALLVPMPSSLAGAFTVDLGTLL